LNRRLNTSLLLIAALFAAACGDTSLPPPVVAPQVGDTRYLVDPRIGAPPAASAKTEQRFDAAWRYVLAGDEVNARKRLDEVRLAEPGYLPVSVAEAAIALRTGDVEAARAALDRVRAASPNEYTAADMYEAELALRQSELRRAYDLYRGIAPRADAPPEARERLATLEKQLFEQLFQWAQSAAPAESIPLLREALAINPGATEPRIILVQRLVAQQSWDEARRELEPLLSSTELDRTEVQEALADIDVGRGRLQEALVRFERLQRRSPNPRYAQRIDEIKERFAAANMPPQFQRAFESQAIDRSDFAVLLYWKVSSVRFAQNLGTPPIAIDVAEVPGREELIRAIAIGVLQVDPITRRVGPGADITAGSLARLIARVLTVRGAACARGTTDTAKTLAACGITDPTVGATADAPVSGRTAAALLVQVDKALAR
jgi:tetratricopeptide (TPR) repeat protein